MGLLFARKYGDLPKEIRVNNLKCLLLVLVFSLPSLSFAYGIGYASYPLQEKQLLLAPEFVGLFSNGAGAGIQGRVTFKPNQPFVVEGGFGVGTGDRPVRIFTGVDYEIFPDYDNQPRVSVKGSYEYAREFKQGINILGVAPTISKGFLFWGHKAYPYFAIPFALGLHDATKTYQSRLNMTVGIAGNIPMQSQGHLIGNAEMTVSLKDGYGGFLLSVAYPL